MEQSSPDHKQPLRIDMAEVDTSLESLPVEERIAAYRQIIDELWDHAKNTNSEGRFWSCVKLIEDYTALLTTLET